MAEGTETNGECIKTWNGKPLAQMSAKDREDLRAQYAASVQVWLTQGEMFWQRFNVMLVIHGAILAGIASTSSSQLKLILPVAGMLLAVGQILQQYRGIAYNLVFRETAIACEELLGGVQPLMELDRRVRGNEGLFKGLARVSQFNLSISFIVLTFVIHLVCLLARG